MSSLQPFALGGTLLAAVPLLMAGTGCSSTFTEPGDGEIGTATVTSGVSEESGTSAVATETTTASTSGSMETSVSGSSGAGTGSLPPEGAGYRIHGGDGRSVFVDAVGDVDGDGRDDAVATVNGATEVYVVYGKPDADPVVLTQAQDGVTRLEFGSSTATIERVASVGDFNGDGLEDIGFGVSYLNDPGSPHRGLVMFGRPRGESWHVADAEAGARGLRIRATPSGINWKLLPAGDVNGDGFQDMLAREFSRSWVVFGSSMPPSLLELADSGIIGGEGLVLRAETDAFRGGGVQAVAGGVDVDGNGLDDIVARHYRGPETPPDPIELGYLIWGREAGGVVEMDDVVAGIGGVPITLDSGASPTLLGLLGDLTGDGLGDVLVGDAKASPGTAYVVGNPDDATVMLPADRAFSLADTVRLDSCFALTDTNGDDRDELACWCGHDLCIAFGSSNIDRTREDLSDPEYGWIFGPPDGAPPPFPYAPAGDVDGDGSTDLLLSLYEDGVDGAAVVFGPSFRWVGP